MVENKRLSIEEMHELMNESKLAVTMYECEHGEASTRTKVNGLSVMNGTMIIKEEKERVLFGMVVLTLSTSDVKTAVPVWKVLADGKLVALEDFGGSMCDDSALFMLDWMLWVKLVPKKPCVLPWGQMFDMKEEEV